MGNFCWGWCCGGGESLYVGLTGTFPFDATLCKYDLDGNQDLCVGFPDGAEVNLSPQSLDFGSDGSVYTVHTKVSSANRGIGKSDGTDLSETWLDTSHGFSLHDVAYKDESTGIYVVGTRTASAGDESIRQFTVGGVEVTSGSFPIDLGQTPASAHVVARSVALDSSGNVWVGHDSYDDSGGAAIYPTLSKYSATGTLLARYQPFDEVHSANNLWQVPWAIRIDASDNIYVALSPVVNSSAARVDHIKKLDSSAVEIWGHTPDDNGNNGAGLALYDSDDRIAVVTNANGASNNTVYVYNAAGSSQWSDNYEQDSDCAAADSNNNLYVGGRDSLGFIAKYDSSGTEITSGNWPIALASAQVVTLGVN